jgi:hypothetical protein
MPPLARNSTTTFSLKALKSVGVWGWCSKSLGDCDCWLLTNVLTPPLSAVFRRLPAFTLREEEAMLRSRHFLQQ